MSEVQSGANSVFQRARKLQREGKLEEAVVAYNQILETPTKSAWTYSNLGETLAKLGSLDDAINSYRQAIELNPNRSWFHYQLGTLLLKKGELPTAASSLGKAIEIKPKKYFLYHQLGEVLEKQGKLDAALGCWQKAVELNRESSGSYHKIAEVFSRQQQWQKSVENYRQAVKINPSSFWSYFGLGKALQRQEEYSEAIAAYERASQINPSNAEVYHWLGEVFVKVGRFSEAVSSYQKAINIQPKAWFYRGLADALRMLGKDNEAIAYYRLALNLKPDYTVAQNNIWGILAEFSQLDEAVSNYRSLQGKFSKSSGAKKGLNWPEKTFIVDRNYRFVYCPIPKVACSSFRKLAVELSETANKEEVMSLPLDQLHAYVKKYFTLSNYNYSEACKILEGDEYFKFVFVRNPWHRLVSAYLDKFVKRQPPAHYVRDVIRAVYKRKNQAPDYDNSITFKQFVEDYLMITPDEDLNEHWQPQNCFLGNVNFDFIGKFENLAEDYQFIKSKLKISLDLPWLNKSTSPKNAADSSENLSDFYPSELGKLPASPNYRQFYSDNLIEVVRSRYKQDIDKFEYKFD
ncbi:tetratricopeptide repeat protein [Planktothrix mougeotii]|uniref:Tetratricopeptide repeat protein n=1 Tax=Planktothrix mougeotii LEGE 06226 TaxID=1828728 RepID=A0ABR9UBY4_9CYAN|nr:tetratricopeptide repeat protein [Planktothrix mougeotii]MBE9143964.1 tetratricopeptide repeat protein [Planktothrix mougeotii LEGE 06226]